MIVVEVFPGDCNELLKEAQHESYNENISYFFSQAKYIYTSAARLLGVNTTTVDKLNTQETVDHRVFQDAHDIIAAAYRKFYDDSSNTSPDYLETALLSYTETSKWHYGHAWSCWFREEIDKFSENDTFVRNVADAVLSQNSDKKRAAVDYLCSHLILHYSLDKWAYQDSYQKNYDQLLTPQGESTQNTTIAKKHIFHSWEGNLIPSAFYALKNGMERERQRLSSYCFLTIAFRKEYDIDGLTTYIQLLEGFNDEETTVKYIDQLTRQTLSNYLNESAFGNTKCHHISSSDNERFVSNNENANIQCIHLNSFKIKNDEMMDTKYCQFEIVFMDSPDNFWSNLFYYYNAENEWASYLISKGKEIILNDEDTDQANLESLAVEIAEKITRKTITDFKEITDTLSGEGTGLIDVWDEICVQVQYDHSFYWDTYDEMAHSFISAYVDELNDHEKYALWLQTAQGQDWLDYNEETRVNNTPVVDDDIVDYLVYKYLYSKAGNWSNHRIIAYIESQCLSD